MALRDFVVDHVLGRYLSQYEELVEDMTEDLFETMEMILHDTTFDEDEKKYEIERALKMLIHLPPMFECTDRLADMKDDWAERCYETCLEAYHADKEEEEEKEENTESGSDEPPSPPPSSLTK